MPDEDHRMLAEYEPATEITFLFGEIEGRVHDIVALVDTLESLCRGALVHCDLCSSSKGDLFACVARLRGSLPDATARRLDFWTWRLGGTASYERGWGRTVLDACDNILRLVTPERLPSSVRSILAPSLGPRPDQARRRLALLIRLGAQEADGLSFDIDSQSVFIPSPRLPPADEPMVLEVRLLNGEVVAGEGVVTTIFSAGERAVGAPAGFVLGLTEPDDRLVQALVSSSPEDPATGRRRAPRYEVRVLATVTPQNDGADRTVVFLSPWSPSAGPLSYVENMSQGGAFVRTSLPLAPGTRVRTELKLPDGTRAGVPGTAIHAGPGGVGIRFDAAPDEDAAVGSLLEHLVSHRRRALIVDDDLLSRRMMGDALARQGFEVFAAGDGTEGVSSLVALLLGLDLLVVDLHMPGVDGEKLLRLVREDGGERDLTVVMVSGSVDPEVRRRLEAAGADEVLSKSEGMESIAGTAVRAMLSRERSRLAAPPSVLPGMRTGLS
jgi:CheY-like chemotaxis protein